MRLAVICALLGFLVAVCWPFNQPSLQAHTPTANWSIQYSPGMPTRPTAGGLGTWYFDFPTDSNYPACIDSPNANCNSVNYVTDSYSSPATQSVTMTFQILTTGTPIFNYVMETDNTCHTPPSVRLFLERRNDDFTEEFYRWWANPISYELQSTSGNVTMTVPLAPDQWSSVYGKAGNYDAVAFAGFQDTLSNLGHVGMTFGGGCFFGHGVNVSAGTARFILIGYTIN